jgi:DNA-binding transcriptional ArsR family regulator
MHAVCRSSEGDHPPRSIDGSVLAVIRRVALRSSARRCDGAIGGRPADGVPADKSRWWQVGHGKEISIYLTIVSWLRILKYMLDQTIELDRTFQALADRSRRTMVERLTLGPASVSELAEPLAMSLAAVVQHVQVLEACGVVKTEKVGRTRMCRIEGAAMSAAEQWIADRRRGWEARLDRLGDILNEIPTSEEKP